MNIKNGIYSRYNVNLQDSIKLTILEVGELIFIIILLLNICQVLQVEQDRRLYSIFNQKIKEWWGAKVTIDP